AAHDQAAVVVELRAHPDRHVEAFVDHVHAPVADVQLHPHLGIAGEEVGQQLGHQLLGDAHRHADLDHATRLGAQAVDHLARRGGLGQHRLRMAVNALADVGDGEAAGGALQQAHAQVVLQLADAPAQARLGNAQGAFGGGEPAVVDHHREVVQIVEVLHATFLYRTMRGISSCLFHARNNICSHGAGARRRKPGNSPMKLLHVDSSVLGDQSVSRELTAAIVTRWRAAMPGLEVTVRDLARDPLPHLSAASLAGEDALEAARAEAALREFLDADVVVIGAPMYNFGIPSTLKAWIDRLAVPGRTFRYTTGGPEGLAGGKRVIVVASAG